jgi:hypothetical protein
MICSSEMSVKVRQTTRRYIIEERTHHLSTGYGRSRWGGNIVVGIKEIGFEGVHWTHLNQDGFRWRTFVKTAINIQVLYNEKDFLTT